MSIFEDGPIRRILREQRIVKMQTAPGEVDKWAVIRELEKARSCVNNAVDILKYPLGVPYEEAHQKISEAHEHLRTAARLLGYRPRGA